MSVETVLFYVFGALALVSALAAVSAPRNPIAGVTGLLATTLSLAGIHVLLDAHFVAVMQILVFTGSGAVLLAFVILLMDPRVEELGPLLARRRALKAVGATAALAFALLCIRGFRGQLAPVAEAPPGFGGFRSIGNVLYTDYAVGLELLALILLAAIVAAVILAARRVG